MSTNFAAFRPQWLWLLLWFAVLVSPLHAAERRVALVIGNSSYSDKPLRNPANDAADLAAALKRMGFEVMERKNRTADQLRGDLSDFQDKLSPGAVGLFYFAGHGVQAGRGQNYLLPVGVTYKRERDAEAYGLEVGSVLRRMEDSGAALSLVILDACRDSPLPPEGRSTASRGLGRMEAPSGSMIAFATAPGSIADDNASGRNGLYTQHLLAAIEAPGVRLEDVFKRVRRGVEKDSNRRQSPEEIMKLTSDEPFYFKAGNAVQVASIKPEPVTPTARPRQASGLSLEDLHKEEETRQAWTKWQGQMKADFDKTAVFAGSADLQAKAWERFLAAWAQDNPLSREDDDLRSQATLQHQRARQLAAQTVPAPAQTASPVEPNSNSGLVQQNDSPVSGQQTLEPSQTNISTSTNGEIKFQWPAAGPLIGGFDAIKNKGLDIGGKAGDPVYAAADGRVVYVGSGLRGYGNLIILKHDNIFLTAYAHNQSLLVKADQQILKGQRIAEMGSSDSDQVKLHFEIRQSGKSVDPSEYLPKR